VPHSTSTLTCQGFGDPNETAKSRNLSGTSEDDQRRQTTTTNDGAAAGQLGSQPPDPALKNGPTWPPAGPSGRTRRTATAKADGGMSGRRTLGVYATEVRRRLPPVSVATLDP
jgi:hypothetical protein